MAFLLSSPLKLKGLFLCRTFETISDRRESLTPNERSYLVILSHISWLLKQNFTLPSYRHYLNSFWLNCEEKGTISLRNRLLGSRSILSPYISLKQLATFAGLGDPRNLFANTRILLQTYFLSWYLTITSRWPEISRYCSPSIKSVFQVG